MIHADVFNSKIVNVLILGWLQNQFTSGTYYTNGKRLVYLLSGIYDKSDITMDMENHPIYIREIFEEKYLNVQTLLPENYNYSFYIKSLISVIKLYDISVEQFSQSLTKSLLDSQFIGNYPSEVKEVYQQVHKEIASDLIKRL